MNRLDFEVKRSKVKVTGRSIVVEKGTLGIFMVTGSEITTFTAKAYCRQFAVEDRLVCVFSSVTAADEMC